MNITDRGSVIGLFGKIEQSRHKEKYLDRGVAFWVEWQPDRCKILISGAVLPRIILLSESNGAIEDRQIMSRSAAGSGCIFLERRFKPRNDDYFDALLQRSVFALKKTQLKLGFRSSES
jgi:hypothetical protein